MHENNWKFLEERRTYMNFEMFEVDTWIEPNEEKIVDTVNKSIEIFYLKEQEKLLTYREFLWSQFRITQKKWWILQMLLLVGIGIALYFNQEIFFLQSRCVLCAEGIGDCKCFICDFDYSRIVEK